jgi:hypothetical protein
MTIEQLGPIRREFKPGIENVVAGIILGVLMVGGGGGLVYLAANGVIEGGGNLPFWTQKGQKGWSWGAAGLLAVVGIGLFVSGVLVILGARSMLSFRVRIGENGFALVEKKAVRVIAWEDVVSVREIHLYERPPLLKGVAKYALPKTMSKSFVVTIDGGDPFEFDGNMRGHTKLAKMIKEDTDRRGIPWEIEEVQGY